MTYGTKATRYVYGSDIKRKWCLIDVNGLTLGRISVVIANILSGKNKPEYTPSSDCGDYVVIVNADKITMTKDKLNTEPVHWHTNHPGGLKTTTRAKILAGKNPTAVIKASVKGMLSKNPLGYAKLDKLFIYVGSDHPHVGQNPQKIDVNNT